MLHLIGQIFEIIFKSENKHDKPVDPAALRQQESCIYFNGFPWCRHFVIHGDEHGWKNIYIITSFVQNVPKEPLLDCVVGSYSLGGPPG